MPAGLTYDGYVAALLVQLPTVATDPNLTTMLPLSIDNAELRCYRDLDFLATHGTASLGNATIGNSAVAIPSTVIVLEQLYYGASSTPIIPASLDFISMVYAGAANGPPQVFAVSGTSAGTTVSALQATLGPAPDATYAMSAYGTIRPAPLAATNQSPWLWTNLPDLAFAAAMVWWSGELKNYGAAGTVDDPGMGMNWDKLYQTLLAGAEIEEARKKFQGPAWAAQQPAKAATPPRN